MENILDAESDEVDSSAVPSDGKLRNAISNTNRNFYKFQS